MEGLKVCPNPNGELGVCHAFDRFGDRCGCAAAQCPLLDTLPNGMFNEGDPLPGLTKQIEEQNLLSRISACAEYDNSEKWDSGLILYPDDCKILLNLLNSNKR